MRSPTLPFVMAFLALQGLAPGRALAQTPAGRPSDPAAIKAEAEGAKAAALRSHAEELFAQGNYKDAITQLRAAWALRKEAPTVILLGESEMKLGRLPDAAGHLAEGLTMLAPGKERARVQALFDEIRPKVGGIELVVNVKGATVIVGGFVGETPIPELFVEPGDLTLTVKKTGYGELQRPVKTVAGKTVRVEVSLSSTGTAVSGTVGQEPRLISLVPAYVAGGLAVIAIGAGIGLRLSGEGKGSEADELLAALEGEAPCSAATPDASCATIKSLRGEHDQLVNVSTGMLVGGGVLLAGAVLYGAVANRRNRGGFSMVPVASPTYGGMLFQGSF